MDLGARLYLFLPGPPKKKIFFLAQGYMKHSSKFCKPSFFWRVSCHLSVTYNVLAASEMDVWEYQSCHIISRDLMRGYGSRMHLIPRRIGGSLQIQFFNACREKHTFWERKYLSTFFGLGWHSHNKFTILIFYSETCKKCDTSVMFHRCRDIFKVRWHSNNQCKIQATEHCIMNTEWIL